MGSIEGLSGGGRVPNAARRQAENCTDAPLYLMALLVLTAIAAAGLCDWLIRSTRRLHASPGPNPLQTWARPSPGEGETAARGKGRQ